MLHFEYVLHHSLQIDLLRDSEGFQFSLRFFLFFFWSLRLVYFNHLHILLIQLHSDNLWKNSGHYFEVLGGLDQRQRLPQLFYQLRNNEFDCLYFFYFSFNS